MVDKRTYHIVIGSKAFFDAQVKKLEEKQDEEYEENVIKIFLELVRLSDERKQRGYPFLDEDKASIMILKNDNYHGIVESAHDRLGSLIEELTTDDAIIYIHNPPIILEAYLEGLHYRGLIHLSRDKEEYSINRQPENFSGNMKRIAHNIFGQDEAIVEISKSMWYLTTANRKKPYVIMLYGGSSLGKSELVREIADKFFNGKFVEKHLSMFKNDAYSHYFFGDRPNRRSLGFDLLERESNLIFLDELDKCPEYFYSAFYTLFDNAIFSDATYELDIFGLLIVLTSNYNNMNEMKDRLGLPIFYRIDKFIHFKDFSEKTIYDITMSEIESHVKECNEKINAIDVYKRVSLVIQATGENARTIKNKIQSAIEEMLFQEVKDISTL
ncbi:AAA family ATPase [Desulfosporosinus metallidurans]|uniref:ClpB protein n=1 Tax=Desulfosporosinus metallidurans TaxID=1888891 RepID=A0A1Q8QSL4_9FIRM|nr:AAA family ATPase [Desulfosporosinus metallidurans]OLN30339.1 ClpB protein [Desulfosporosinus metallidurans]